MYKYLLILAILITPSPVLHSSDDSINQFTYGYLQRINEFLEDENYVEAQRELDVFVRRYFSFEFNLKIKIDKKIKIFFKKLLPSI